MKEVTNLMIRDFKIKKLGWDFMGYSLQRGDVYTFHHLIIPARKKGPYACWNGAILCGKTSHEYLHRIEAVDYDIFDYITREMIDINTKGYLDTDNIKKIHNLLLYFENEYSHLKTKKGKRLIKDEYKRRVNFNN